MDKQLNTDPATHVKKDHHFFLPPEIREQLSAPMPPEAIAQHPSKTYLSTIKQMYIIERLNNVFGVMGWRLNHEIVKDADDHVIVSGWIYIHKYDLFSPIQFGGATKKSGEEADAYKSAVTDMMSKVSSYLEIGIDVFKGKVDAPKKETYTAVSNAAVNSTPVVKATPAYDPNKTRTNVDKTEGDACDDCGEKMVKSPKTQKVFCGDKCWTKKKPDNDVAAF